MILCVGLAADRTFCHTLAALASAGVSCDVVELAQFSLAGDFIYPLEAPSETRLILHGHIRQLASYRSAWVRLHDISRAAPSPELCTRAAGIYLALGRLFTEAELPVVNPPFADNSNFTKPFHSLQLARLGWRTPRTCLTDDPDVAEEFIESCRYAVIFKGVSSMKTWASPYEDRRDRARLPLIRNCPVLLQERIDGPDVRVHVLGSHLFAEEIETEVVDYRLERRHASFRQIRLPLEICNRCFAVAELLRVPFLGIDLKRERSSGEWLILEANSMPGYEGYDRRARGAISRALVEWLTRSRSADLPRSLP